MSRAFNARSNIWFLSDFGDESHFFKISSRKFGLVLLLKRGMKALPAPYDWGHHLGLLRGLLLNFWHLGWHLYIDKTR